MLVDDLLCFSLWLADTRVSPEANEIIIIDVKCNEKYYVVEF